MKVSVVIASKDRHALLSSLLATVLPQVEEVEGEVIVVDDGSTPPYEIEGVRLLRTTGVGPARARNSGAAAASGDIIAFTDDDVQVQPGWLRAALDYLESHPEAAGVTGDTSSPSYSPLYEHSVEDHDGGSYLTCNVAYRRSAFLEVGGFDRLFPHAAHEDRDLAWRIMDAVGPVGFEPGMRVTHPGRPFRILPWWRRGRLVVDDWLLLSRHPHRKASRRALRFAPLSGAAHRWLSVARSERIVLSPRRAFRWLVVAGGQLGLSAWMVLTRWKYLRLRDTRPVPGLRFSGWRIAYVGPSPHPRAGGAPGVAGLLIDQLLDRGHSVDVFVVASREDDDPRGLGEREGLNYVVEHSKFAFEKWYSKSRLTKMMSSQLFAARGRRRLGRRLAALHQASPYDVVYQFSAMESFGIPRHLGIPVVMHPSVHAVGERRWHDREGHLSSDSAVKRRIVSLWLRIRSLRQQRDAQRATGILALSQAFADEVMRDYDLRPDQLRIVPNCIDLSAVSIGEGGPDLLVVGRLAVRKGLDDVVALGERLNGQPAIDVIGAHSLWSDYRGVVSQARGVSVLGHRSREEVYATMGRSRVTLQLSRYEPFGLTVAESLAAGTPVVVTPAVGAAEGLPDAICTVVAPGDIDALEAAVKMWCSMPEAEYHERRHLARAAAERFRPTAVADLLESALHDFLD